MPTLTSVASGIRELTPRLRRSEKGPTTLRRWRGTLEQCQAESFRHGIRPMEIVEEDSPWFVLEVSYEGWPTDATGTTYPNPDTQFVTLYELTGSRFAKPIWEFPAVAAELNKIRDFGGAGVGLSGLATFRADLLALARGEKTTMTVPDGTAHGDEVSTTEQAITLSGLLSVAAAAGASQTIIQNLFDELARGTDSYQLDSFVLRSRRVGPANGNPLPAYLHLNVPTRTSTLLGENPDIPVSIQTAMRELPNGYWFASAPELKQTDADRIELVRFWQHAEAYSTFLYGAPR